MGEFSRVRPQRVATPLQAIVVLRAIAGSAPRQRPPSQGKLPIMEPANPLSSFGPRGRRARLSRQEWVLLALGLGVWVALACGGTWLVHQFTRTKAPCGGGQVEARTSPQGAPVAAGPRNALQLLTGTGRCQ
jgi:hypothetical protein